MNLILKLSLSFGLCMVCSIFGSFDASAQNKAATPLDRTAQIVEQKDRVFDIFEDVVVVQRKAKDKRGKFLFNPGMTLDFSDGPTTLYTVNANVGYAISDFFEAYLNFVPTFLSEDRSIVKKLNEYSIQVKASKPKAQYGVEILWLPAYGKDSWGPYSIVRSDTFFKFGYSMIQFESGNGSRMALLVGKTYFLHDWFNLRVGAGVNVLETIVDSNANRHRARWSCRLVHSSIGRDFSRSIL